MGEGYAAIQRGGGLPVVGGRGSLVTHASLPYIKIYVFKNTYSIEIKKSLSMT